MMIVTMTVLKVKHVTGSETCSINVVYHFNVTTMIFHALYVLNQ
jgi:hypothetical protein